MTISKRIKGVHFKKNNSSKSNSNKKKALNNTKKISNTQDNIKKIISELDDEFITNTSIINNILE